MERKIIYEPHPVLPERKAELRAMGFVIIDAIYAPKGCAASAPEPVGAEPLSEQTVGPAVIHPSQGQETEAGFVADKRDPLDHDGDGKKGGSLPKGKRGRKAK